MNRACQYRMSSIQWSVAEYNNNNAWFYNGNNGKLNNNNKYNSNLVRPCLAQFSENDNLLEIYPMPYELFFECYLICRRKKRKKVSQLMFEINRAEELIELCHEVNLFQYQQRKSIVFVITKPKIREVIAADFRDRVVQTLLVQRLLPYLEAYEHKDSYSCRIKKGGLAAALQFREYVREMSNNYTEDCYVFSLDFKAFFTSIDTKMWTQRLCEFTEERYKEDDIELVTYLAKSIYLYQPQTNCVKMSPQHLFDLVPPNKSMLGRTDWIGVAIGNVTSQTIANFITTLFLFILEKLGVKFVCYTDDIKGVTKDKQKLLKALPYLRDFATEELHLKLHPDKFDIQHYSKGLRVANYKIRFGRMLPNDRLGHNWLYKASKIAERGGELTKILSVVNSYLGMMRHGNTFRLRKRGMDVIMASKIGQFFTIDDEMKAIHIRKKYTTKMTVVRNIKETKREQRILLNKIS